MDHFITAPRVRAAMLVDVGEATGAPVGKQSKPIRCCAILLGLLLAQPQNALAQVGEAISFEQPTSSIRWWHGVVVLGGLSWLTLLDKPVQQFTQANRTPTGDEVARAVRSFGQPEVFATVALGVMGAGLATGDDAVTRAGGRLAAALALGGAASTVAKWTLGRSRPSEGLIADRYVPFSGEDAMPSGHTTVAFALATALADDIDRTWASLVLYTFAAGVAWSRVNDNRHWLSDVGGGAVLGVTAARVVNGRWRIFNLRPPRFLLGPEQAQVAWQVSF
jgi:membrane-associated phospholipid phosphatase